jgi:hypothetical protein
MHICVFARQPVRAWTAQDDSHSPTFGHRVQLLRRFLRSRRALGRVPNAYGCGTTSSLPLPSPGPSTRNDGRRGERPPSVASGAERRGSRISTTPGVSRRKGWLSTRGTHVLDASSLAQGPPRFRPRYMVTSTARQRRGAWRPLIRLSPLAFWGAAFARPRI